MKTTQDKANTLRLIASNIRDIRADVFDSEMDRLLYTAQKNCALVAEKMQIEVNTTLDNIIKSS